MAHTGDPAILEFMMEQAEITASATEGAPHDRESIRRALATTRECFERRLLDIQ